MMTRQDMLDDITYQISQQSENLPISKTYFLKVKSAFDGESLSEIIKEAFVVAINISNPETLKIHCTVTGEFKKINIENNFPRIINFDKVQAEHIIVQSDKYDQRDNLIEIYFNRSNIKKIEIIQQIECFYLSEKSSCEVIQIFGDNLYKDKYSDIYITGLFKELILDGLTISGFIIDNSKYKGDINYFNSEIKISNIKTDIIKYNSINVKTIEIVEGKFNKIQINANNKLELLKISNLECKAISIICIGNSIGNLIFESITALDKFEVIGSSISQTIISIRFDSIFFSKDFQGEISSISIGSTIFFDVVKNRGDFTLSFVNIVDPMSFFKSLMGNVFFFNCKMSDKIIFHSSNIEDLRFYNTLEPEYIIENSSNKNYSKNIQNAFRQLKISSEKSGNKENASYYRSRELDTYYSSLSFLNKKQVLDKITVGLNKLSNNHGTNWLWPIFWIWYIGTINYFLFISTLDVAVWETYIKLNHNQLISSYLEWFIPGYLHPSRNKLNVFLECFNFKTFSELSPKGKLIIFFNDIIIFPYLIYQFIAAFRRHGLK